MRTRVLSVLLACFAATVGTAYAQNLDQEMQGLADRIGKTLTVKGSKSVAAVDFTDIQGRPTELGRFLSEQLTVDIVATSNVSMVDRANIKHILAEHNLTVEGLVDPANAKKLGEFAGVDTILVGTITEVDDGYRLMVKGISTSSSQIVAAGWITFRKTPATQDIGNRGVSENVNPAGTAGGSSGATSDSAYREDRPIATKDIGAIRIVLKSVVPVGPKEQRKGVLVTFEFSNRETRNPLVVAMNGEGQNQAYPAAVPLRSRMVDDRGGAWSLLPSGLYGLASVSPGVHGRQGQERYNPAEIARLLRVRDEIGRDTDDPGDGYYSEGAPCGMQGGYNTTFDSRVANVPQRRFCPYTGNTFISGSTTTIEPGQSTTVTMTFVPQNGDAYYGSSPRSFQIQSEIAVGVLDADRRRSYSLQNLTFDRVTMQAF